MPVSLSAATIAPAKSSLLRAAPRLTRLPLLAGVKSASR